MGSAPPRPSARAAVVLATAIAAVSVGSECAAVPAWLGQLTATGEPPLLVVGAMAGVVALFAGLGAWFWRRRDLPMLAAEDRAGGWWWCLAIAACGTLPRVAELALVPYDLDYDSGLNGCMALDLLALDHWTPTAPALGIETLYLYMIAASFKLFGVSVLSLRLPGALLGAATPVAVFAFARQLLGRRVALLACGLAAFSPWLIVASREARHANWVGFLVPATYAVLLGALARGRRRDYALGGVLLGLSFHAYSSYRHGIPVALAILWWHARRFRGTQHAAAASVGRYGWLALGILVPVAPILPHVLSGAYADYPGLVRDGTVGAFGLVANALLIVPHTILLRAYEDPGIGLAFGLLVASALPLLVRWHDPRGFVLGALAVAMLAPPLVASGDTLAARRYAALVPVLFPMLALALDAVVGAIGHPRRRWGFVALVCLAWLACEGRLLGAMGASARSADPRQHVLRSALDIARDAYAVIPGGYVGDDPAWQFLARCPGIIDPPEGQYHAIGRVDRELWFVDATPGTFELGREDLRDLGARWARNVEPALPLGLGLNPGWSLADLWAGILPIGMALAEPEHRTLTVVPIPAAAWNRAIQGEQPLDPRGWFFVARAGRYALDLPSGCALELGGAIPLRVDSPGTLPLSCGFYQYAWSGAGTGPTVRLFRWIAPSDDVEPAPAHAVFWGADAGSSDHPISAGRGAMPVRELDVVPTVVKSTAIAGLAVGDVQDLALDSDGGIIVAGSRGLARTSGAGLLDPTWQGASSDSLIDGAGPPLRSYRRAVSVDAGPSGIVVVLGFRGVWQLEGLGRAWRVAYAEGEGALVDIAFDGGARGPFVARRRYDQAESSGSLSATWQRRGLQSVARVGSGLVVLDQGGRIHWVRGSEAQRGGYCGLGGDDVRVCASASGRIAICLPTRRMVRFFDSDGHALAFRGDPAAFDALRLSVCAVVWADDGQSFTAIDRAGTLYDVVLSR